MWIRFRSEEEEGRFQDVRRSQRVFKRKPFKTPSKVIKSPSKFSRTSMFLQKTPKGKKATPIFEIKKVKASKRKQRSSLDVFSRIAPARKSKHINGQESAQDLLFG